MATVKWCGVLKFVQLAVAKRQFTWYWGNGNEDFIRLLVSM